MKNKDYDGKSMDYEFQFKKLYKKAEQFIANEMARHRVTTLKIPKDMDITALFNSSGKAEMLKVQKVVLYPSTSQCFLMLYAKDKSKVFLHDTENYCEIVWMIVSALESLNF